jgi:tetratricopeptide (TPR) repeat protein
MRFRLLIFLLAITVLVVGCERRTAAELTREAEAALDAGDEERGVELLQKALKIQPRHEEANYQLGRIYQEKDRDDLAVPFLERAVQTDPEDAKSQFRLGEAYLGVHENERALSTFYRAMELDPDRGGPYAKAAQALLRLGREAEARRILGQGLQRVPQTDPYYQVIADELK